MTAIMWKNGTETEVRNHIYAQDARFQRAMRKELTAMAHERGLTLAPRQAPKKPSVPARRPHDVLSLSSQSYIDIPESSAHRIMREVCEKHGCSKLDLRSEKRPVALVIARQEAMYRMSRETTMSMPAIGMRLARDHTTVLYGIRKHKERMRAAAI